MLREATDAAAAAAAARQQTAHSHNRYSADLLRPPNCMAAQSVGVKPASSPVALSDVRGARQASSGREINF